VSQSLSVDKGRTWGEATATGIPNPDSKVQALRLMSGHLALVFNAHRKLKTVRKARALLDLAISADGDIPTFARVMCPTRTKTHCTNSSWTLPPADALVSRRASALLGCPGTAWDYTDGRSRGSPTYNPSLRWDMDVAGGISWVRIARVDGELEPGLRCHYPTMVESEDAQVRTQAHAEN
jgi:hypothetical protein